MQKNIARKAITAKDVAEACGVSQATVSYVINNSAGGRISESTRQKVLEMSRSMGYCPSSSARSMRINRAMAVGVVLGGNSLSMGVSHALRGVKRRMDAAGYAQVLLSDDDVGQLGVSYLSQYRAGRIDALLFLFRDMPAELTDELHEQNVPYLALSEQGITGENITISSGYQSALNDCARLMRERGFARARFYSLQNGPKLYSFKFDMFRDSLARIYPEAQLERVVIHIDELTDEQILDRLQENIKTGEFDIAITPHARLGYMVQNAIMRDGLHVPQRIKHICLSTSHPFAMMYPSITMVDIPLTRLGEVAADYMLNMLGAKVENISYDGALPTLEPCRLKQAVSTL